MSLSTFLRINLPYGISINEKGELTCFNREYRSIGLNDSRDPELNYQKFDQPVWTKYKGVNEKFLLDIASGNQIDRHENGSIKTIWFYSDETHPTTSDSNWKNYMDRIKKLSKLERKAY